MTYVSQEKGALRSASDREEDLAHVASLLSVYPDLARINDPIWLQAVRNATHYHFSARTVLFRGVSPLNQFILVLKGDVRVYYHAPDGRELTLYRIHPGDLCILSLNRLFQNRYFDIVAQAASDIYALGISESDFRAALSQSEDFRNYVLSSLNGRLCELMCLVQDTAFQSLKVRLACLLGRLSERNKSNTLQITHQEIAQELGSTREVVSRLLKEFQQHEYVRLARGEIVLNEACTQLPGFSKS